MITKIKPDFSSIILDSLNDGLYVCDTDRKILYWSKSAERITGWTSQDVVGHTCSENILVHVDQDGRALCGEEFCPLHRSMHTNKASSTPLIVFGQISSGERIPMAVSVAPIHDEDGKVVGGVETFHDFTATYCNLKRAKRIQALSMDHALINDDRVRFDAFYLPHEMIGGDYIAFRQLDSDLYGFMLADVMGHGVAAALYTMHLSSLWDRYSHKLIHPADFAHQMNRELCEIVKYESFATAICGVLNASSKEVRVTSAGGPPLVLFKFTGETELIEATGSPFGMADDAEYDECEFQCESGDCLLIFSDGAVEIQDVDGQQLGTDGLIKIMKSVAYPASTIRIEALQKALLIYSNEIRLDDDLTLLDIRFS